MERSIPTPEELTWPMRWRRWLESKADKHLELYLHVYLCTYVYLYLYIYSLESSLL